MRDDLCRRLDDLTAAVAGLKSLVAWPDAGQLPGLLLARAAVATDEAAGSLERHLENLRLARRPKSG